MSDLPKRTQCGSAFVYEDAGTLICSECAHEWPKAEAAITTDVAPVIHDANGNVLADGDSDTSWVLGRGPCAVLLTAAASPQAGREKSGAAKAGVAEREALLFDSFRTSNRGGRQ